MGKASCARVSRIDNHEYEGEIDCDYDYDYDYHYEQYQFDHGAAASDVTDLTNPIDRSERTRRPDWKTTSTRRRDPHRPGECDCDRYDDGVGYPRSTDEPL
jgi:hypothetical protein